MLGRDKTLDRRGTRHATAIAKPAAPPMREERRNAEHHEQRDDAATIQRGQQRRPLIAGADGVGDLVRTSGHRRAAGGGAADARRSFVASAKRAGAARR